MKTKFWKGFWVGVLTCVVLAIAGTYGVIKWGEHVVAERLRAPKIPAELRENYDFRYTTLAGMGKHLSDSKGKVVFANIWGTWCIPCVAEMPTVQKLYDIFKADTNVVFILPSRLDAPEKVKSFAAKHNYTLPFCTMKDEDIPPAMQLNQYPMTFIYAKDGSVAMKHVNAADWSDASVVEFIRKLERQ